MPHIASAQTQDPCPYNSPQNLIFHSQPRKVRFWPTEVIDKGTFVNRFPSEHVFLTNYDPLLRRWNPQLRNKCNWWPSIPYVLRWDHDRTALNSSSEGARRLQLLSSQPIYRETWGRHFHFTFLEAEKNINTLLTLDDLVRGALLPRICKCAFLLTRFLPIFFHASRFFFLFPK